MYLTHTSTPASDVVVSPARESENQRQPLDRSPEDRRGPYGVAPGREGNGASTRDSRREPLASELPPRLPDPSPRRLEQIPLELIEVDPDQVRRCNDVQTPEFAEMCANVAEYGVLQPVLVRPAAAAGRYILIAGEFRLEAARRAGHTRIPCSIEEARLDPTALVLRQLSENLHRKELPHLDLALSFDWLTRPVEQGGGGLTGKELARRLGKSEAFVSEHRRLLNLSPEDQQKLAAGALSFDQARARLRKGAGRARTRRASAFLDGRTAAGRPPANASGHRSSPDPARSFAGPDALPDYLDQGQYVYREYSGHYAEADLLVVLAGAAPAAPSLEHAIRAVEHHLHFLKLTQRRRR